MLSDRRRRGGARHALLVHPTPQDLVQITDILRNIGCDTLACTSTLEALRSLNGERIDLMVIDADTEGAAPEFSERLHSRAGAPVVYVCSGTRPIGFHALTTGLGFLTPPYDPQYAQRVLERALLGPGRMA